MEWQCDTLSDASYFICQHNLNAKRFLKFDMHLNYSSQGYGFICSGVYLTLQLQGMEQGEGFPMELMILF